MIYQKKKILRNYIYSNKISKIVHLAAQAGVRYSITNPDTYITSNIIGFYNILEVCREFKIKHLVFSSTSSVYGNSNNASFKESDNTDQPVSLYAATKKSNEVMAYSYSELYNIPITVLRLFTVYGPFGRPDMALFKFVDKIYKNKKIELFNSGNHIRDFTYVDDVVNAIILTLTQIPTNKPPINTYNVASANPEKITNFVKFIENILGKTAKVKKMSFQKGDIYKTSGNIGKLKKESQFKPSQILKNGIIKYVKWYKSYYKK